MIEHFTIKPKPLIGEYIASNARMLGGRIELTFLHTRRLDIGTTVCVKGFMFGLPKYVSCVTGTKQRRDKLWNIYVMVRNDAKTI